MAQVRSQGSAGDPEGGRDDEIPASVYYSDHDLREMFSRENAERRRQGAKTLRRYLTAAQDKQVMNRMVRIREEYEVANNDDVILVWAKQRVEEGKGDEVHPRILDAAKEADIPLRTTPVYPDPEK